MSCWVVPSVAADLWGVPLATVLEKAKLGLVPSKDENGFTFVDVAADGDSCDPPKALHTPHPPTFTVINEAELFALAGDENPPPDDWRAARKLASRSRKAPAIVQQTPFASAASSAPAVSLEPAFVFTPARLSFVGRARMTHRHPASRRYVPRVLP